MDLYLLLTPLLVFGILSLIRFIGCNWFFGLEETVAAADPPQAVKATPGDQRVEVTWVYDPTEAVSFEVIYGTLMGGPYPDSVAANVDPSSTHKAEVQSLTNGTTYYFRVTGDSGDSDSVMGVSDEVSATPGVTSFITAITLGPQRNNFTGWVGMAINVGPTDVVVTQLGRIVGPGNTQAHVLKIVEAGPGGADVASVTISMPAGPVGELAYVSLPTPVTLQAFRLYFVVSHEVAGGDIWHDLPNVATTTNVASITSGVFNDDAAPGFAFAGGANQMYGPVSFRY